MFLGSRARPVRRADNLTAICEPISDSLLQATPFQSVFAFQPPRNGSLWNPAQSMIHSTPADSDGSSLETNTVQPTSVGEPPEAVTGHTTQLKVVKVFRLIRPVARPEAERGRQRYCGADTLPRWVGRPLQPVAGALSCPHEQP
jgi:hypothetical protein